MAATTSTIDILAINTIRTLAMDAVQQANSGHPGTPMALAPVAYSLWSHNLRFFNQQPGWPDRDRFVLSCGHASMLLYAMLHLTEVSAEDGSGPAISLDAIRSFRQLHSACAGHPEFGEAAGIETTTGPLGQGISNSVGMAIASRWMAANYNRPGHDLFGHRVFAFCSDGDLMEGIGCEAASLAGHLGLDNLCWVYDDNNITIEGNTSLAFSEDVPGRFRSLGWHTIEVEDANDLEALSSAWNEFDATQGKPTLIVVKSVIAWGAPNKANTHGAHGAPLGEEEIALTKQAYDWPLEEPFAVPDEVRQHFAELGERGRELYDNWNTVWESYQSQYGEEAAQLKTMMAGELPTGWDSAIPEFPSDDKSASRASSGKVINAIAQNVPWFFGGSADLAPSTKTLLDNQSHLSADQPGGRNMHFGIREHAMAAAANGMSLSGLRPFTATFFTFSDYLRPSMRLSAIMGQPVLYVFTHDSIGVGEDGPTHQPIEHLAACRSIPNLNVMRPGDANEVAACYRAAMMDNDTPTAMILSRQGIPALCREEYAPADGALRGGYVLADAGDRCEVILMGTGSELSIAEAAYRELKEQGIGVRLVSMPCWELFDAQEESYRESVLPAPVTARVAVEAGIEQGWRKYLGTHGRFVGMTGYGASAPAKELYAHFGIDTQHVVEAAKASMGA